MTRQTHHWWRTDIRRDKKKIVCRYDRRKVWRKEPGSRGQIYIKETSITSIEEKKDLFDGLSFSPAHFSRREATSLFCIEYLSLLGALPIPCTIEVNTVQVTIGGQNVDYKDARHQQITRSLPWLVSPIRSRAPLGVFVCEGGVVVGGEGIWVSGGLPAAPISGNLACQQLIVNGYKIYKPYSSGNK